MTSSTNVIGGLYDIIDECDWWRMEENADEDEGKLNGKISVDMEG